MGDARNSVIFHTVELANAVPMYSSPVVFKIVRDMNDEVVTQSAIMGGPGMVPLKVIV